LYEILLKEYLNLKKLHEQIARGTWKYEDESGDRIVASLRIEFLDTVFICLFIWEYDNSVDLECTEGLDVNSLFYVKFKKKTDLSIVKNVAADLVMQLITNGQIEVRIGSKDYKVMSVH
jgi:hypothetical protein